MHSPKETSSRSFLSLCYLVSQYRLSYRVAQDIGKTHLSLDPGSVRSGEHRDAFCAHRCVRSHGFHSWQVRNCVTSASGKPYCDFLCDIDSVRLSDLGFYRLDGWIQHPQIPSIYKG